MLMKQGKIMSAYDIINMLMDRPYEDRQAWGLFQIWKKLEPIAEFQKKEHMKLMLKHGGAEDKPGQISFTGDDRVQRIQAYVHDKNELEALETDVDIEPLRLPLLKGFQNCGNYFKALDGIIDFYNEEEPTDAAEPIQVSMEEVTEEEMKEEQNNG